MSFVNQTLPSHLSCPIHLLSPRFLPYVMHSLAPHPPSTPVVRIKLLEKSGWSVRRAVVVAASCVAGYDFGNEFVLGEGSKGLPCQITATKRQKQRHCQSAAVAPA